MKFKSNRIFISWLCFLFTIEMIIWTLLEDKLNTFNLFFKVLCIIISGLGGIAIWLLTTKPLIQIDDEFEKSLNSSKLQEAKNG